MGIEIRKRPRCAQCLRAQCICQWVRRIESQVELLILQHPLELHHAKGSARLLHLCMVASKIVIGEVFDTGLLGQLLDGPFEVNAARDLSPKNRRQAVLLYPKTALGAQHAPMLMPEPWVCPDRLRLVVIDGTWRKTRKMLALNPQLASLPRIHLTDVPSNYVIRKAHRSDQLSTFEATCAALLQIEGASAAVANLLEGFMGFVGQQMANAKTSLPELETPGNDMVSL
jgi:DTW domain-containing protein